MRAARSKKLRFSSAKEVTEEVVRRGLPRNFCHVPFSALILEPDGRVGSCRVKGTEFPVGNLNSQTLEEIWNGPVIRQWRREFLSGDVRMCKTETRHKRCHTCPSYNAVLPEVEPAEIQTKPPLRLILNLNGKCNLECQMCHIWKEPNGLYDSKGWWKQAEPWFEQIEELEMLSGEPLIQRDTYRLIDLMAERNPDCVWTVTTNAHWRLSDTVREALDRIRFKHMIVSIDSLDPEIYARIRRGGDLRVPLKTLDELIEYERARLARGLGSLNLVLNFVLQRDNWREFGSLHDFGAEKGMQVSCIPLYEPPQYSLMTLPEREREDILKFYLANLTREQLLHARRAFLPVLDTLDPLSRARWLLELRPRLANAPQASVRDTFNHH